LKTGGLGFFLVCLRVGFFFGFGGLVFLAFLSYNFQPSLCCGLVFDLGLELAAG
jgi:hypothetical protein